MPLSICCQKETFAAKRLSLVVLGSPSVAPIKGVQLCVGVLKLKSHLLACADATMHGVPHLSFFEFKAVGQHDARPVFLPSGRVSDGLYIGLGDTLYPDCRAPRLTIDIEDNRSDERLDPIWADGCEDFPDRPTMLTVPRD
jgi:hypothetical protein